MFVRNATNLQVRLAHGHLFDELAVAAVVVSSAFRIVGERLEALAELPPVRENDPPDISGIVVWEGVSVTVAGSAAGPPKPPYVTPVRLRVGDVERRLIVFGERRWERHLGAGLSASPPESFESIVLSFRRAFGGGFEVPPGLLAGTDLPHPGYRMAYPLNEHGVGYYPDESAAAGAPLPNIEWPHQLVRRWNDAPEPAGFSPCPELVVLRAQADKESLGSIPTDLQEAQGSFQRAPLSLRILHHAPPSLIFDRLVPGMPIDLHGLGIRPLSFVVPPSPASVTVRRKRTVTPIQPRLRGLHVDSDECIVRLVHDHSFTYDPRRPPSWVRITRPEACS